MTGKDIKKNLGSDACFPQKVNGNALEDMDLQLMGLLESIGAYHDCCFGEKQINFWKWRKQLHIYSLIWEKGLSKKGKH